MKIRSLFITAMVIFLIPLYAYGADNYRLDFESVAIPQDEADKSSMTSSPAVRVIYPNGVIKTTPLSYNILYRSFDRDKLGGVAGLIYDINGKPLQQISNFPDGSSVFVRGDRYFLLTHFEQSPGAVYLTEFKKEKTGKLKAVKFSNIDFSPVNGTFINCAGSKTPWDTHLASEEDYYLDSFYFDPTTARYTDLHIDYCDKGADGHLTGSYTPQNASSADYSKWAKTVKAIRDDYLRDPKLFNPYNYGYHIEIAVDKNGKPSVVNNRKHYTLGKLTPEMALVMPDNRTVYITEDGTYGGLYMFIADRPKNLSAGTLYMAKWEQISAGNGGKAKLSWIKLGHGDDNIIKKHIDKKPVLSDMFDIAAEPVAGYRPFIFSGEAGNQPKLIYLRLRDGENGSTLSARFNNAGEVRAAVAFLEPRKYGVYLGGTAEFRKMEGIAYNRDDNVMYIAVTAIEKSMEDNPNDPAQLNDIRLPANKSGAVYQLNFASSSQPKTDYLAVNMEAILTGRELREGEQYSDENALNPEYIANPDNLGYFNGILFIGEDSLMKFNNSLWAYNTKSKKNTRIMSAPTGGEITGTFPVLNTGDMLYVFVNIQHPFGDKFKNAKGDVVNTAILEGVPSEEKRGAIGYFMIPLK